MLASILNLAAAAGYPTLFAAIAAESAGIPLPGETTLVAAALLASQHRLNIVLVILVAAGAAIIGDNLGYVIGREGGRRLLERPGLFARGRRRILNAGLPLFARHGARTVFFGRWITGLRTWASWLAGATRMPWKRFAVWNAGGGISWATTIGLSTYFAGTGAKGFLRGFAIYGTISIVLAVLAGLLWRRVRRPSAPDASPDTAPPLRREVPADQSKAPTRPTDVAGRLKPGERRRVRTLRTPARRNRANCSDAG